MKYKIFITAVVVLLLIALFPLKNELLRSDSPPQQSENNLIGNSRHSDSDRPWIVSKSDNLLSLVQLDNAPIEFYGIVVDENEHPLSGVEVQWSIVKAGSFFPSLGLLNGSGGILTTKKDGRFVVKNERGSSFGVDALSKNGYRDAFPGRRSYGYGSNSDPHFSDQLHPVTFVMIPECEKRPIKREVAMKFDWDGEKKEYNLKLPNNDIHMYLTPKKINSNLASGEYDWKLLVEVSNATLVIGNDIASSIAPLQGYTDSLAFENKVGEGKGGMVRTIMYAKTSTGKYIRIELDAYSDRGKDSNTGYLSIRWNPDGGRVFPR